MSKLVLIKTDKVIQYLFMLRL